MEEQINLSEALKQMYTDEVSNDELAEALERLNANHKMKEGEE